MAAKVSISQEAFDAVVKENMEEFDMEMDEAIEDAIHTFKLQGADLSGIITTPGGVAAKGENPVAAAASRLQTAVDAYKAALPSSRCRRKSGAADGHAPAGGARGTDEQQAGVVSSEASGSPLDQDLDRDLDRDLAPLDRDLAQALEAFEVAVREGGPDAVGLAGRSGATETAVVACEALVDGNARTLEQGLRVVDLLLADDANKQAFLKARGPTHKMTILAARGTLPSLVHLVARVAATAGTKFELNKEEFMDLNAHTELVALMRRHVAHSGAVVGTADALRVFSTADDTRVAASKTFGNARRIAEAGAVEAILEAARCHVGSAQVLASLCLALKAVAVNDEICRSVADHGGVDLVLGFLTEALAQRNKGMARSACSLLVQLAGSDQNKEAITAAGGLQMLVGAAGVFSDEPAVLQESFATIGALALRQPGIADLALQAGAADVAAEAMEAHPGAAGMLRQACMMLRNLAVRNPENRPLILEKGVEPLLRQTKARHEQCRDVASAALRDLGFDDYND